MKTVGRNLGMRGLRGESHLRPSLFIKGEATVRKILSVSLSLALIAWVATCAPKKDLEIEGKNLISKKPPFNLVLPSELSLTHSFSHESPKESSLTRVYFFIKEKDKRIEEMLILQIADKTNPQAEPMTVPPLKAYTERGLYSKGKVKKGQIEIDYLTQMMAWNPDAPSLQPIMEKGFVIPAQWALQGQFLFPYQGENAVFCRYSRAIDSFGTKVSDKGDAWEKGTISGDEKKAYETFQKTFMGMIDSIQLKK